MLPMRIRPWRQLLHSKVWLTRRAVNQDSTSLAPVRDVEPIPSATECRCALHPPFPQQQRPPGPGMRHLQAFPAHRSPQAQPGGEGWAEDHGGVGCRDQQKPCQYNWPREAIGCRGTAARQCCPERGSEEPSPLPPHLPQPPSR